MDEGAESPTQIIRKKLQPPSFGPAPPTPAEGGHHQSFWLWVMCLTGVDYFSTLGYIPSIAYKSTGFLSPIATLILVAVTLFGALPVYAYVASKSPKGLGSIALLERMVRGWTGKLLVLTLLGFVATAFFFTKTLSAADAAKHLAENPMWQSTLNGFPALKSLLQDRSQLIIALVLLMALGAMFMRGFREVIGMAVVIVAVYLLLNLLILGSGITYLLSNPDVLEAWTAGLHNTENWGNIDVSPGTGGWGLILLVCLLYFPKLALGLSGFETGLMVMPLIKGKDDDKPDEPEGRIRNTRKLLLTAAVIMCFFLICSSLVTTTLITEGQHEGKADERALAFLAHGSSDHAINPMFGQVFGSIYDLSTVVILWFAGASAMAGLLNLVPQYLPRYGMAPEWAKALKPLILLFTAISLTITLIFNADVTSQGAPYATGVLVFIFSGCTATLIDRLRSPKGKGRALALWWLSILIFGLLTVLFFFTTVRIIVDQPQGMYIAMCIIAAIIVTSMISRAARSKELRFMGFQFANEQSKFLWESMQHLEFPVMVPHRPGHRTLPSKEASIREDHRLAPEVPIVFIEAILGDPSEFYQSPLMEIRKEEERFIIRVTRCASIAHMIAALGLELSKVGKPPEIHFGWSDESPVAANLGFLLFGAGNVPWMVRELISKEQPNEERRPRVIVG